MDMDMEYDESWEMDEKEKQGIRIRIKEDVPAGVTGITEGI